MDQSDCRLLPDSTVISNRCSTDPQEFIPQTGQSEFIIKAMQSIGRWVVLFSLFLYFPLFLYTLLPEEEGMLLFNKIKKWKNFKGGAPIYLQKKKKEKKKEGGGKGKCNKPKPFL